MRTQEEKTRQLEGLHRSKEVLPEVSEQGDPLWAAVDAQISIIEGHRTVEDYATRYFHEYITEKAYEVGQWLTDSTVPDIFHTS